MQTKVNVIEGVLEMSLFGVSIKTRFQDQNRRLL